MSSLLAFKIYQAFVYFRVFVLTGHKREVVKGGIIYDHCFQSFPPCLSTFLQLNISSIQPLILLLLNQQSPPCGQFLNFSFTDSLVALPASAASPFLHLVSFISYSISPQSLWKLSFRFCDYFLIISSPFKFGESDNLASTLLSYDSIPFCDY